MQSRVNRISANEARRLLDKDPEIILLDVRQPEEYEKGHIPGALLIPLPELLDKLAELNTEKKIITYCRLGRRSLAAAQLIADERDSEVYTIDGGIMAWNGLVATGDVETCMVITGGFQKPEEFISLAYTLEDGSERFYLRVSEIFSDKKAVELFKNLSNVEENHKKRISERILGITIDQRFIDYMEGCIKISEAIDRIFGKKDLRDALEYSMQIETNSLDVYMKILREVEKADELFKDIIDDEKAHLKKLGELLSEYEK